MLIKYTKEFLKAHNFRGYDVGFGWIHGPDAMNISVWEKKTGRRLFTLECGRFYALTEKQFLKKFANSI
jgi:hypothetical protein